MRKFLLLLALVVSGLVYGQRKGDIDYLYLKNGNIIRGVVVEYNIDGNYVKIMTQDGSVYQYSNTEIDKISKVAKYDAQKKLKGSAYHREHQNGPFSPRAFIKGYRGYFDFGYTFKAGNHSGQHFAISTTHGYQFNPHFFLGMGVATNFFKYGDYEGDKTTIPLYANARVNLLNSNITPYFDMKLGHSFLSGDFIFFNPSVGVSFAMGRKLGMYLSLGYSMQRIEVDLGTGMHDEELNVSGIALKLGVEF